MIDWMQPNALVSIYMTVMQMIWLPQWERMAIPQDGLDDKIKANLTKLAHKLDVIQIILGSPLIVHSGFRPNSYTGLVGGSIGDAHTLGMAVDFHVDGMKIENIKEILVPLLEGLDVRLEQGTSTWIHVDIHQPGPSGRYFKPISLEQAEQKSD